MKLIFGFWFPVLLGNLFQQVYNLVDSVIVGRFVGVNAFAGVSATGSLNFLIIGFLLGMCSGCAIPVAQSFGEGDPHAMRKYFANAIYLCGGLSVAMSVATVLLTPAILRWTGTPEDIFNEAYHYIVYIFGGMTAIMLYNLSSGVLRAVGNTRTPLYFLILSCAVNVALDFAFVVGLGMGVTGAALATVMSQLLSGALCLRLIFKMYDVLHIHGEEWQPDTDCLKRLAGIGGPMGMQFSITAIGSLVMQTAVNGLGSGAPPPWRPSARVQRSTRCSAAPSTPSAPPSPPGAARTWARGAWTGCAWVCGCAWASCPSTRWSRWPW